MKQIQFITHLLVFILCSPLAAAIQPMSLTCEYKSNPLSIDITRPWLTRLLTSSERNQRQAPYEILVATSIMDINIPSGTVWQTGNVDSDVNTHITYEGKALRPFTRYYWRVRVYDQYGKASDWSEVGWFETAMIEQSNWKASWISDGSKQFERDEDFYKDDRMPLFRKSF